MRYEQAGAWPVTQTLSEHIVRAWKCRRSKALNGPANTTLAAETWATDGECLG